MASISALKTYKARALKAEELKKRAFLRNIFLNTDNYSITQILRNDLLNYLDGYDISRMKLVTLDTFSRSLIERIIQVHKNPLVFRFEDGTNEDEKGAFVKLMNTVRLNSILAQNDLKLRMHNTFLTAIRYFQDLDKLWLDNSFDASNTTIISYPGMITEPAIVIREDAGIDGYWIWDRIQKLHYYVKGELHIENNVVMNDRYEEVPLAYWPFITCRYEDLNYGFWQTGYDSIVELNRLFNILYTIISDDSVQETMRLLILNFIPLGAGTSGYDGASSSDIVGNNAPAELKTGMRNPVYGNPFVGDREPSAEVVSADLYNKEIVELVEKLGEQISSLHGVDNVLKDQLLKDVSSLSLKIKNENSVINWKKDINICRPIDREIIEKIIEVNNLERDNKIDTSILNSLTIDYAEPSIAVDDYREFELERLKWEKGVSNPVLFVQKKNPELTEKQAEAFIRSNLELIDDLYAISSLSTGSLGEGIFGDIE